MIRTKLTAGRYLTDAHVITKFANLRVYLLGAFEALESKLGYGISYGPWFLPLRQCSDKHPRAHCYRRGLSEQADFSKINVVRRVGNEYVYYRLDMLKEYL